MPKKKRRGPTKSCHKCGAKYHPRKAECPECGIANPSAKRATKKAAATRTARQTAKKAAATRKRRQVTKKAAASRNSKPADALAAAITFVEQAGGLEKAKEALGTIERIKKL